MSFWFVIASRLQSYKKIGAEQKNFSIFFLYILPNFQIVSF